MSKVPSNGDPKNTPWYISRDGVNLFKLLAIFFGIPALAAGFMALVYLYPIAVLVGAIGIVVAVISYDVAKWFP